MKYILVLLISFAFGQEMDTVIIDSGVCYKFIIPSPEYMLDITFGQDLIFEESHIGIGDPPGSLPPFLHIFGNPPIEIYDIIIVDGKEIRIIKDTCNPKWKKYPSLKTKVIMTVQYDEDWGISSRMEIIPHGKIDTIGIWYLNYKEYWNDMLLCEPNPDAILEIIECKHGTFISSGDGMKICTKCGKGIIYNKKLFNKPFQIEESHIGIGDPPNSLPSLLHIFEKPPIK